MTYSLSILYSIKSKNSYHIGPSESWSYSNHTSQYEPGCDMWNHGLAYRLMFPFLIVTHVDETICVKPQFMEHYIIILIIYVILCPLVAVIPLRSPRYTKEVCSFDHVLCLVLWIDVMHKEVCPSKWITYFILSLL